MPTDQERAPSRRAGVREGLGAVGTLALTLALSAACKGGGGSEGSKAPVGGHDAAPTAAAATDPCAQPRPSTDLQAFLCAARAAPLDRDVLRISDVIARLPGRFRRSFTLKHGVAQSKLRGHPPASRRLSTSADLDFPRVLMWDEVSGFSISFNGGLVASDGTGREQSAANRLGILTYDDKTHAFELWALDIPLEKKDGAWRAEPYRITEGKDRCKRCHGPRSRPIWPMYPDWLGFYGSDNDELTKGTAHQTLEREFHGYVRECVAARETDATTCKKLAARARKRAKTTGPRKGRSHADRSDTRRRYATLFDASMTRHLHEVFTALDHQAIRAFLLARAAGDSKRPAKARLGAATLAIARGTDATALQAWLGLEVHASFPYRPNHAGQLAEASRAFFHRPNSRLGFLYNRLNARNLMEAIRAHPSYREHPELITFAFMDCSWADTPGATWANAYAKLAATAKAELARRKMALPPAGSGDNRILYPALLATVGLALRDVDIRFSYGNRRFAPFDASYTEPTMAATPMSLGYIAYRAKDHNRSVNGATRYFNSYFDGSASLDELLVAHMLADLAAADPVYADLYVLNSLYEKYAAVTSRWALDAAFLTQMDAVSKWFPLPYPNHLFHVHHRQSFKQRRDRKVQLAAQHRAVCQRLRDKLSERYAP